MADVVITPDPRHARRAAARAARRAAGDAAIRAAIGIAPGTPVASSPLPMPVVCTGRGTHERTVLSATMTAVPPDHHEGDSLVDHGTWSFERCPRCGRHVEVRAERLTTVWPALRDADITELDISRLPF